MINQVVLSRFARSLFFVSLSLMAFGFFSSSRAAQGLSIRDTHLVLEKSLLGKELLLRVSMAEQAVAATSQGGLSRVVYFQKHGDQVFLMESPDGHVVTNDLPAQFILAQIPIVREDQNLITLDFNKGMSRIFTANNWHGSDGDGRHYSPDNRAWAFEASHSFISGIFENKSDELEIRQLLQMRWEGMYFPSYEVRYYLSPYKPNKEFVSRENPKDVRQLMYFETAPFLEQGLAPGAVRSTTNITRWDVSQKPVIYYVSANTPPEFVQAVREGILYWNKAFGAEVMRAELAPAGISAPDSRYNMVQWVPNDSAGFAYADALSDPRTGEILNSQIYMTSVFGFLGKERARKLLRSLKNPSVDDGDAEAEDTKNERGRLALNLPKFLRPTKLCDMDVTHAVRKDLEALVASDADDAAILRVAQDYIRIVVAHEVGHTLGLRHNFLGHTAMEISQKQRDEAFFEYLKENKVPSPEKFIASSSVMDYLEFKDDILVGRQMMEMNQALPYDALAIRWGYAGKEGLVLNRSTAPLFCTDSHVDGPWKDCSRFFSGSKPIEDTAWRIQQMIQALPQHIVETYIAAKSPLDARDAVALDEVSLNPTAYARSLTALVQQQLVWLNSTSRAATIEHRYPQVGVLNQREILEKTWSWVQSQITEQGGVEKVFFSLLPKAVKDSKVENESLEALDEEAMVEKTPALSSAWVAEANQELKKYLEKIKQVGFANSAGARVSFTDAEMKLIENQGTRFFKKLEKLLVARLLGVYSKAVVDFERVANRGAFISKGVSEQFESHLARIAEQVVLATSEGTISGKVKMGKYSTTLSVPMFRYSFEVRQKAVELLQSGIGKGPEWSLKGRRAVAAKLKDLVENAMGRHISDIKLADFDKPIAAWAAQQDLLLEVFSNPTWGCVDILMAGKEKPKSGAEEEDKPLIEKRKSRTS